MRVYICKDSAGTLFRASDELAEVLDHCAAPRVAGVGGAWLVRTGAGYYDRIRYATHGEWRVMVDAHGHYSCHQAVKGGTGWWKADETIPDEMEDVLCFALGIVPVRTWTAEEILAREG